MHLSNTSDDYDESLRKSKQRKEEIEKDESDSSLSNNNISFHSKNSKNKRKDEMYNEPDINISNTSDIKIAGSDTGTKKKTNEMSSTNKK